MRTKFTSDHIRYLFRLLINSFLKITLNEAINCPLPPLHVCFFQITACKNYKTLLRILATTLSMSLSTLTNHLLPYEWRHFQSVVHLCNSSNQVTGYTHCYCGNIFCMDCPTAHALRRQKCIYLEPCKNCQFKTWITLDLRMLWRSVNTQNQYSSRTQFVYADKHVAIAFSSKHTKIAVLVWLCHIATFLRDVTFLPF